MADITKLSSANIDGLSAQHCVTVRELFAGEALKIADACFVASDGKAYMCNYTSHKMADATVSGVSDFVGFTNKVVHSGEPVTLFGQGAVFGYAAAMTPGQMLYISTNNGLLADAKSGIDEPVAKAISVSDILVIR
jgi:hypothetical protein